MTLRADSNIIPLQGLADKLSEEEFFELCMANKEFHSSSDNLNELKAKMSLWIENGVSLAWLIDPEAQNAWIYRPNGEIALVEGLDKNLEGEEVLPGFALPLRLFQQKSGVKRHPISHNSLP